MIILPVVIDNQIARNRSLWGEREGRFNLFGTQPFRAVGTDNFPMIILDNGWKKKVLAGHPRSCRTHP